jgi:hypothetical protein
LVTSAYYYIARVGTSSNITKPKIRSVSIKSLIKRTIWIKAILTLQQYYHHARNYDEQLVEGEKIFEERLSSKQLAIAVSESATVAKRKREFDSTPQ